MRFLILFFTIVSFSFCCCAGNLLEDFHACKTRAAEQFFLKKYASNLQPAVLGYYYTIQMKQADYTINPVKKLSMFLKYKNLIEATILANPQEANLRYVRLLIQEKAPAFLGYKQNIAADKLILQNAITNKTISDLLIKYIILNTSL